MNIAIIGAGWFGCHLASALQNEHKVTVFEKEQQIFQSASGHNQYRLHCGLHYPRSHVTRDQIIQTSSRFVEHYGKIIDPIRDNLYAISKTNSLIDFGTFLSVLRQDKIVFEIVDGAKYGLTNIEGTVKCQEKSINTDRAKHYFESKLQKNLRLGATITEVLVTNKNVLVNKEPFDYVINCTYNRFQPINKLKVFYEADLVLTYKNNDCQMALTVMDGPLASFYPFHNSSNPTEQLFTLTSVAHTPIKKFKLFHQAQNFIKTINASVAAQKRPLFEKVISKYYPAFKKDFIYTGYFKAIKTKLYNTTSSRELIIDHDTRITNILSGKISHIFLAEDAVKKQLEKYN